VVCDEGDIGHTDHGISALFAVQSQFLGQEGLPGRLLPTGIAIARRRKQHKEAPTFFHSP
jgi:hypothetical protein